jgi:hypothetical protein
LRDADDVCYTALRLRPVGLSAAAE